MRTAFWVAAAVALVIASVLLAEDRPGSPRPYASTSGQGPALDEIRAQQIAAHVEFLADDLLEGRAPATRGGQLAAKYLAAQLALLGYEPAGDNGTYFQEVPIVESIVSPRFALRVGAGTPFVYLQDVVAFTDLQEPTVAASGEVVFVGHG